MRRQRIVVLGGTGLLGQHTAAQLLRLGHHVRLFALDQPPVMLPGVADCEVIFGNAWEITDDELATVFTGYDGLVYALGPDDRQPCPAPAQQFFQRQLVAATERVVRVARASGMTRAVICGSYFAAWDRMNRGSGFAQRHPYVAARLSQTHRAIQAGGGRRCGGLDVCVLEIPYVFGTVPGLVPFWREFLFDRVLNSPVVAYPDGGSSVVSATQVGQAAAAAVLVGQHGARYPLADLQLRWPQLLELIAGELGVRRKIVTVPRWVAEPAAQAMGREMSGNGLEPGINPQYLMRDIMYARIFVDPAESLRRLRYQRGGVVEAIAESVRASYPGGGARG